MNFSTVFLLIIPINFLLQVHSSRSTRDGFVSYVSTKRAARSLAAEVKNSTMLILKGLPQTGGRESCSVSGYIVQVKQQGVKRAQVRKVEGVRQTITLQNLMPDTVYNIRLITITCEGKGKPSRWVTVRTPGHAAAHPTEPQQPGVPKSVFTRAYSDSIFVSWQPPDGPVPVEGYVVGYGEGVPDVNWQYIEGHRRNVTIRNLKKGTQYVISVRAYNVDGKGPVVYELVYTNETPPFAPPPAPTNLRSRVLSPTTVMLEWVDPSLPYQHSRSSIITDNRYYNIHYQSINPSTGQLTERTETSKKLQVVINGLTPATRYEFKVRTIKDGQTGRYSISISNRTLETAPGSPPRSVVVTVLTTDEETGTAKALVQWRPPRLTNGNITDYMIQYTDNVELASENWQSIMVRQMTEEVVEHLQLGNSYYFRVQAKNLYGYGPKSDITKINVAVQENNALSYEKIQPTTTTTEAFFNKNLENETVEDVGDDEYDYNDKEEASLKDQEDEMLQKNSHTDASKRKREQNVLSPDLEEFNPSRPDHVTVDFKVLLQVKVNAFITWPQFNPSLGCQIGVRSKGYRLRYRKIDSSEWPWVVRNLQDNMVVLEDLELNAKYAYQVKYATDAESAWSTIQHLSTHPKMEQQTST